MPTFAENIENMPTVFYVFGLRFYFYSEDHLPVHIHVQKGKGKAKFKVYPEIELIENKGLKAQELSLARSLVEENKEIIIQHWKVHFSKSTNPELQ